MKHEVRVVVASFRCGYGGRRCCCGRARPRAPAAPLGVPLPARERRRGRGLMSPRRASRVSIDAPVSVRVISSAIRYTSLWSIDSRICRSRGALPSCLNTGESSTACFEFLALTVGEGEGATFRRTGHCEREFGARCRWSPSSDQTSRAARGSGRVSPRGVRAVPRWSPAGRGCRRRAWSAAR